MTAAVAKISNFDQGYRTHFMILVITYILPCC